MSGLASIALASQAVAAAAPEWWWVAQSQLGLSFADRTSIAPLTVLGKPALKVTLWEYHAKPDSRGTVKEASVVYFDCEGKGMTLKSRTDYDKDGGVITSYTNETTQLAWIPAPAGTVGGDERSFVCNAEKGAGDTVRFAIDDRSFAYVKDPDATAKTQIAKMTTN